MCGPPDTADETEKPHNCHHILIQVLLNSAAKPPAHLEPVQKKGQAQKHRNLL